MIERHALWSSAAAGRGYILNTPTKRIALARWNEVALCERFGWTPHYYRSLPAEYVEDVVEICNIRDHYANKTSSPS